MRESFHLVQELRQVRDLLRSPARNAMYRCEQVSLGVIQNVGESKLVMQNTAELGKLLREIRVLLENAKAFWRWRERLTCPGLQYGLNGSVVISPANPSFTIEA